ncbi:hypothetical protein TNIN_302331 [Trichonephila inaurata madagascariensis]|uniref:Uncharacterized protein n=1 Tax=Trichonephila inaurata madagascariensis TaxID=2747483 RepID=A0A8X7CQZ8_9ARAC|nr:hypothetical protein TNIN_302331 [Trichonephila inaurata madagascariensis]
MPGPLSPLKAADLIEDSPVESSSAPQFSASALSSLDTIPTAPVQAPLKDPVEVKLYIPTALDLCYSKRHQPLIDEEKLTIIKQDNDDNHAGQVPAKGQQHIWITEYKLYGKTPWTDGKIRGGRNHCENTDSSKKNGDGMRLNSL